MPSPAAVATDYVFPYKPNPAIVAGDQWHPDHAHAQLRDVLEKTRGCHVEIVLKDISTTAHQPHRLWQWAQMASELVQEFSA